MSELLDLPRYVGQRAESFRYDLVHVRTGARKGQLTPLRGSAPSLSHDTASTISRRVSGLRLGVADTARINPLTDRIEISMLLGDRAGTSFPLGRYMIANDTRIRSSGGTTTPLTLYDEMFIVDQELDSAFAASKQPVDQAIVRLLEGLPIGEVEVDATAFTADNAWSAGSSRASALKELSTVGGYFKPWFNHLGALRVKAAFEPAGVYPDFDLDEPPRVIRNSIAEESDLVTAPNRFVVVSNDTGGGDEEARPPVVGIYDVPASAPHSIAQRGFVLPTVVDAQVATQAQAASYARTLGLQTTVYERVELSTPIDPRHDGYDVVRWDGRLWLETGWSMQLTAGGEMRHSLRRAYPNPEGDDL